MVPWSIRRVTDLPPNAKLHEMQQNTHRLVQLIRAATPNVPNQTPMPQLSKQMLNACLLPPMHIIVQLLPGRQSSILSSNEWHNDMGPVHIPNRKGVMQKEWITDPYQKWPKKCAARARLADAPRMLQPFYTNQAPSWHRIGGGGGVEGVLPVSWHQRMSPPATSGAVAPGPGLARWHNAAVSAASAQRPPVCPCTVAGGGRARSQVGTPLDRATVPDLGGRKTRDPGPLLRSPFPNVRLTVVRSWAATAPAEDHPLATLPTFLGPERECVCASGPSRVMTAVVSG